MSNTMTAVQNWNSAPADVYLTDDRKASDYVNRRGLRDVTAFGEELRLGKGNLGYATVFKTNNGYEIAFKSGGAMQVVQAVSFVCASAFILARFW